MHSLLMVNRMLTAVVYEVNALLMVNHMPTAVVYEVNTFIIWETQTLTFQ